MSYSFFYQAPKRTDDDTLIVDGKKLLPNTAECQSVDGALLCVVMYVGSSERIYPTIWLMGL